MKCSLQFIFMKRFRPIILFHKGKCERNPSKKCGQGLLCEFPRVCAPYENLFLLHGEEKALFSGMWKISSFPFYNIEKGWNLKCSIYSWEPSEGSRAAIRGTLQKLKTIRRLRKLKCMFTTDVEANGDIERRELH